MWILHLSDIHLFSNSSSSLGQDRCVKLISYHLDKCANKSDVVLVISGDISSKGSPSGYSLALEFFRELSNAITSKVTYVICPGNHDIINNDRDFNDYNKFVWSLTRQTTCHFNNDTRISSKSIDDYDVIVINSAFHIDKKYGQIDTTALETTLIKSKSKYKIVVQHHHLIPTISDNKSSVVNSYETIKLLLNHGVFLVLHGHMHTEKALSIGESNSIVIGVGSLFQELPGNLNNQFNLISVNDGRIETALNFRYILDYGRAYDGLEGDFVASEIAIM